MSAVLYIHVKHMMISRAIVCLTNEFYTASTDKLGLGWIYLCWTKRILNRTFWLPPLDQEHQKNILWICYTFTSEKENSSNKTLLTSRFARKQKKYSRITMIYSRLGHFFLAPYYSRNSDHVIVPITFYAICNVIKENVTVLSHSRIVEACFLNYIDKNSTLWIYRAGQCISNAWHNNAWCYHHCLVPTTLRIIV